MIPKKMMRVIVTGLLPSFCLSARSTETPIQPSRYLLIEATAVTDLDEVANQSPANQKTGSKTDSALDRFLKEPRHGKWKVFEDDLVTFSYPDYPGMQVAARDGRPAPGTKFYGDPTGSVNRQSNRFYSVLVEGVTWAVVMLQDDPWFDEGICFCGEVGMRVYVADSGCLRAYDLLTTGRLKKLQVNNGGKRLQVFESTHLPMSQENYVTKRLRFVLDRTAAPSVPAEDWLPGPLDDFHNLLVQIKDNDQRLGFIKEGINHPHPDVRWAAYLWWLDRLPPDDALAAARKGLDDANERVRLESAEAFTETLGTKSDLEWLANHVKKEQHSKTKALLQKAISRLGR